MVPLAGDDRDGDRAAVPAGQAVEELLRGAHGHSIGAVRQNVKTCRAV
jgi:hypothetical protein